MNESLEVIHCIREFLSYDQETGIVSWAKTHKGMRAGRRAGTVNAQGYRRIAFGGVAYREHRIAWLLTYGSWPACDIDHINRRKDDNRISNLRLADSALNKQNLGIKANNTSGVTGVYWSNCDSIWKAQIQVNGKVIALGRYKQKDDAVLARQQAQMKYHPFSNPNARA